MCVCIIKTLYFLFVMSYRALEYSFTIMTKSMSLLRASAKTQTVTVCPAEAKTHEQNVLHGHNGQIPQWVIAWGC